MKQGIGVELGRLSEETVLTHHGRHPEDHFGFVNTPVFRGSTVLFKTLDDMEGHSQRYYYGRQGNPSVHAVTDVITQLEGAHDTRLTPSGLSAVTLAILAAVKQGGEILVTDSAYEPTRIFCDDFLARMGVSVRYYDPRIGAGIAELISERTQAIFCESPGSGTFEIQDIPAIAAAAKPRGVKVIVDNSWASPLYLKPLALGADIVLHAATKMFVGHSDAFGGTVSATKEMWPEVDKVFRQLGLFTAGDEAFLMARGLRTLAIRMKEHQQRALELALWLEKQDGVLRVLHPALPTHPDHALFKRDFKGSGSLFGVLLTPAPRAALASLLDNLQLFSMGYSWGGYESLCIPVKPAKIRTAVAWKQEGNLLRIHVGLEGLDDLKADLAAGLTRYLALA